MTRKASYVVSLITKRWLFFVGIGMLLVILACLFLGRGQDIWFDESYSMLLAQQPLPDLFSLTGVDAHPPLFYLVLKLWGSLFGWSELALRSMSAIIAALTVGAIALIIRRLFTPRVSLVALPFLVMAPFWLRYGYEIRMYALAGLICALGTLALISAVSARNDWRRWALYALTVAAGMYTLYMTAVVWLAHVVWLFIYHRKDFWRQPWVRTYLAAIVLFVPYIPTLIFQLSHSALPGIGQRLNLTHIGEVFSQTMIYTPEWSTGGWSSLGIVIALGLTIYLLSRSHDRLPAEARRRLALLLCLVLVPAIFFLVISLPPISPIFVSRYLAHFVLFFYAIFGVAVALGWRFGYRRLASLLFVVVIALFGWGEGQLVQAGNFNYERMQRPQTSKVRQLVDCDKTMVLADDAYTYINDMYYFQNCDLRYYSTTVPWYQGGYAWLANHGTRVASAGDIQAKQFVHLYWTDHTPTFTPDDRYHLVSSTTYDRQVTDTYQLNGE